MPFKVHTKQINIPLINGYLPNWNSTTELFEDSPMYTDGTDMSIGHTSPGAALDILKNNATTNGVTELFRLTHTTSGTAADGIGTGINFRAERASGTAVDLAYIQAIMTDATAVDSALVFFTRTAAGAMTEQLRISDIGTIEATNLTTGKIDAASNKVLVTREWIAAQGYAGDGMYAGNGTVPTNTIATITDNLTFGNVMTIQQGSNRVTIQDGASVLTIDPGPSLVGLTTTTLGYSFLCGTGGRHFRFLPIDTTNNAIFYGPSGFDFGGTSGTVSHQFYTQGTNMGSIILNVTGASTGDFRILGDTDTHLLFTDASLDRVGIGTSTVSAKLHIKGTGATSATSSLLVEDSSGTDILKINDNKTIVLGTLGTRDNRTTVLVNGNNSNSQTSAIGLHVKGNIDNSTNSHICLIEHTNITGGSPKVSSSVLKILTGWIATGQVTGIGISEYGTTGIGIDADSLTQLKVDHVNKNHSTSPHSTVAGDFTNAVSRTVDWGPVNRSKYGIKILSTGTWNHLNVGFKAINVGLDINVSGGDVNYGIVTLGGNSGFGTSLPLAMVHAKGLGATSTTSALLVENSSGANGLEVRDDGVIILANLPTSSAGLPSGALWNNSNVINIV